MTANVTVECCGCPESEADGFSGCLLKVAHAFSEHSSAPQKPDSSAHRNEVLLRVEPVIIAEFEATHRRTRLGQRNNLGCTVMLARSAAEEWHPQSKHQSSATELNPGQVVIQVPRRNHQRGSRRLSESASDAALQSERYAAEEWPRFELYWSLVSSEHTECQRI